MSSVFLMGGLVKLCDLVLRLGMDQQSVLPFLMLGYRAGERLS